MHQARARDRLARWVAGREVIQEQIAERQLHRMIEEEARLQEGEAVKKVGMRGFLCPSFMFTYVVLFPCSLFPDVTDAHFQRLEEEKRQEALAAQRRAQNQRALLEEASRINEAQAAAKRAQREAEIEEDRRVAAYLKKKADEERVCGLWCVAVKTCIQVMCTCQRVG